MRTSSTFPIAAVTSGATAAVDGTNMSAIAVARAMMVAVIPAVVAMTRSFAVADPDFSLFHVRPSAPLLIGISTYRKLSSAIPSVSAMRSKKSGSPSSEMS